MESTKLQSTFESIDNNEFEEKVDIEDLVLASKPTAISNSEIIDIKKEPKEQSNNNAMPIHESKTDISNRDNVDIKEEPTEQNSNIVSIHESKKTSVEFDCSEFDPNKSENFQSELENDILKLFEKFDMMKLHDYDQMRVGKVRQLVEKYQKITQEAVFKLHENTLEVKTNELVKTKEELQMAKSTNLTLSKRIQELEMSSKGPSIIYVSLFLRILDQLSTLVSIY